MGTVISGDIVILNGILKLENNIKGLKVVKKAGELRINNSCFLIILT